MLRLSNGYEFDIATASGALGYGRGWWWEEFFLIPLGVIRPEAFTIITKTLTKLPRVGNLKWWCPWRCVRLLGGGNVVNAVSLTNPGMEWWIREGYPKYVQQNKQNTIVSIMPENESDAALMGTFLRMQRDIKGVEVNVSCTNVKSVSLDQKIDHAVKIVMAVQRTCGHPVGVKLGWQDPYLFITKELEGVIEWVDLINTVPWDYVFPHKKSPLAKYGLTGGVSGPKIAPFARQCLDLVVDSKVRVPVLSGGGINSYQELNRRFKKAAAVTLGSPFLTAPHLPNQMERRWRRHGRMQAMREGRSAGEYVGRVTQSPTPSSGGSTQVRGFLLQGRRLPMKQRLISVPLSDGEVNVTLKEKGKTKQLCLPAIKINDDMDAEHVVEIIQKALPWIEGDMEIEDI